MDTKNGVKTVVLTYDLELLFNCAMRYCMGRRTYMPSVFCSCIKSIMGDLSLLTLERMKKDFENQADDVKSGLSSWGDECDKEEWMQFKLVLDTELNTRTNQKTE